MSGDRRSSPALIFLIVAGAVVAAGVWAALSRSIQWGLGALAGVNLATLLLYGYDKAGAGGTRRRVPENVLHLLALLGGSPTALLAQSLFRHKTVKAPFRRTFWLIVLFQLVAAG